MTKVLSETTPLLETFVDSLMSSSCFALGPLVSLRNNVARSTDLTVRIALVSFHHFARQQPVGQLALEDLQV